MKGKFFMSKKTKNKPKIYDLSSSITVNGQNKSSASSTKNGVKSSYNMDPYEQAAYNFAQKSFYENMPNVNVFFDETVKNLNNQVNAYLNQGINTIQNTYTPMIREMQNDVARRFGNVNNSIFMDNLNDIESKRAGAISDLAQNVEAKRNELVNNELANRYDYLNFLNGYQNQVYNNMLSMLGLNNNMLNTSNSHLNKNTASNNNSSNGLFNTLGDVMGLISSGKKLF